MRFAIKTRPEHQTWEEIRDAWLAADELPLFESAWNWDHFYPLTGDMAGPNFEAWTMLGAFATATRRIRIGCQVTGMIYRHPAVLANMAATVDIMSGGRLELGIGAGWNQMECDAYGIALPPLKERFDRFDEGVESMVMLLTEPVSNFPGQYVRLTDARCEPKPVQRPRPPIVIGGGGEKRTLRIAAKYADQWNAPGATPEVLAHKIAVLHGHCADIGRDPSKIEISVQVRSAGDPAGVADDAATLVRAGAQHVIVGFRAPFDATRLEPIAHALRAAVPA